MGRTLSLSRALWSFALATSGCGRLGFDAERVDLDAAGTPLAVITTPQAMTSTCGDLMPAAALVVITNTGTAPLVVATALATGGFTVQTALPLSIDPGSQGMLAIVPPIAVIGTDRGGTMKTGMLTLTTNEAGALHQLALGTDVVGANLDVTDDLGQSLDLTFASTGCPPPKGVHITNNGTSPAVLAGFASGSFALAGYSGGMVSANSVASSQIRPITNNACSGIGNVQFTVTGAVCTTTPLVLSGTFNIVGSSSCFCS